MQPHARRTASLVLSLLLLACAPATAQDRPLMVFFEHNSALVSAGAQRLLDFAVADLNSGKVKTLSINGHTDASERQPDALSMARSEAVASVLIAKGVALEKIKMTASGSKAPMAPKAKDPQNSRVEVILRP